MLPPRPDQDFYNVSIQSHVSSYMRGDQEVEFRKLTPYLVRVFSAAISNPVCRRLDLILVLVCYNHSITLSGRFQGIGTSYIPT